MSQGPNRADAEGDTSAGFVAAMLQAAARKDPKQEVEAVLRMWAGCRVYIPRGPLQRGESASTLAWRLVAAGVGTRAVAAIVRDRHGISTRHARRLARAAVDMRGHAVSAFSVTMGPL